VEPNPFADLSRPRVANAEHWRDAADLLEGLTLLETVDVLRATLFAVLRRCASTDPDRDDWTPLACDLNDLLSRHDLLHDVGPVAAFLLYPEKHREAYRAQEPND
jgi:hypothetical protein